MSATGVLPACISRKEHQMFKTTTAAVSILSASCRSLRRSKGESMTRKDFNLIAETIRQLPSFETFQADGKLYPTDAVNFDALCHRFAETLATTNPRFNKDHLFIAACNGKGGR
jgi:hypothetical protein